VVRLGVATGRRVFTASAVLGAATVALGLPFEIASSRADHVRPKNAHAAESASASDRRNDVSTTNGFPRHYEAIYHGDEGLEHAGVLDMTADGKLAIVSADDRFAEMLDTVARNMNAMPHETVRVPPASDEPRFALKSRVIPRSSAEFIPTMLANIRRGYRLELLPGNTP
jgi:hypothetical protein